MSSKNKEEGKGTSLKQKSESRMQKAVQSQEVSDRRFKAQGPRQNAKPEFTQINGYFFGS
jgi:hypothetical protein